MTQLHGFWNILHHWRNCVFFYVINKTFGLIALYPREDGYSFYHFWPSWPYEKVKSYLWTCTICTVCIPLTFNLINLTHNLFIILKDRNIMTSKFFYKNTIKCNDNVLNYDNYNH